MNANFSHRLYPYIYKNRFYNYKDEHRRQVYLYTLYMLCASKFNRYINNIVIDPRKWRKESNIPSKSKKLIITWIGHCTFLIQVNNINILTDPIFNSASFLFPRVIKPGIMLENIPKIDYVLLSHNHRDHMDASSLKYLYKKYKPLFLVAQGDAQWFKKRGMDSVFEYMWWEKYHHTFSNISNINTKNITNIDSRLEFTFVPAYHWSQRGVFDFNKSLWGGWVVQTDKQTIFFAGDTGYSKHFKSIYQEFESIDYALLPIGPCEPHDHMIHSHLNAEQAGQAFLDLQAKHFIPMHWGTYYFGLDLLEAPVKRLMAWWQKQRFNRKYNKLSIPKIGESLCESL